MLVWFLIISAAAVSIGAVVDFTSLVLVIPFSIIPGIIGFGINNVQNAFKNGLGSVDLETVNKKDLITGSNIFKTMFISSLLSGILGTMIGFLALLMLTDEMTTVGQAVAITFLTTIYGILFAVAIFLPLWQKLKNAAELKCSQKKSTQNNE